MKEKRGKIFVSVIILCLIIVGCLFNTYIKDTMKLYNSSLEQLCEIIIKVKEDRLKEIIERTINEVELERKHVLETCDKLFKNIERALEIKGINIDKYNNPEILEIYPNLIMKMIIVNNENEIVYSNDDEFEKGDIINNDEFIYYKSKFKYSLEENFINDNKFLLLGIKESDIENSVKIVQMQKIKEMVLANEGYIWVHEIIDYNGGDGYAKRVVHPDIIEGEENILTTNFKDIKGNEPYKDELEGINKNGEALIKYYFKKRQGNEVYAKLGYTKLYPRYNWAIGTGIYMDDIEAFIAKNISSFQGVLKKQILVMLITTITLLMISAIVGILIFDYYEYRKRLLIKNESELFKDHYSLLEKKYDIANEIIHDIKNHLICLDGLAKNDKAENVIKYINSVNCDISQLGYTIVTRNKIIDIILNEKLHVMKSCDISFEHHIEDVDLGFIELKDLATAICNLLDNAIESCIVSINKKINFELYIFNATFVVMKVSNSSDVEPKTRNGKLVTSKKNKLYHGYGVKNIIKVVNKYNGNLKWNYNKKDNEFSAVIMIPKVALDKEI